MTNEVTTVGKADYPVETQVTPRPTATPAPTATPRPTPTPTPVPIGTTVEAPAPLGTTLTADGLAVTVESAYFASSFANAIPRGGYKVLIAQVTLRNDGNGNKRDDAATFSGIDANTHVTYDPGTVDDVGVLLRDGTLEPGEYQTSPSTGRTWWGASVADWRPWAGKKAQPSGEIPQSTPAHFGHDHSPPLSRTSWRGLGKRCGDS